VKKKVSHGVLLFVGVFSDDFVEMSLGFYFSTYHAPSNIALQI